MQEAKLLGEAKMSSEPGERIEVPREGASRENREQEVRRSSRVSRQGTEQTEE